MVQDWQVQYQQQECRHADHPEVEGFARENPHLAQRHPVGAHIESQADMAEQPGHKSISLGGSKVFGGVPGEKMRQQDGGSQGDSAAENSARHGLIHEAFLGIPRFELQQVLFRRLRHK